MSTYYPSDPHFRDDTFPDHAESAVWFRVEDVRYAPMLDEWGNSSGDGRTDVVVHEYAVLKETACGVWLESAGLYGRNRFVLRAARKRFACPTREEALASFVARKNKQLRILKTQIRHIEQALALASAREAEFTTDRLPWE